MQEDASENYFERRAEEERRAAELAADERAAQSHRELSNHYRNIARGSEQAPADDCGAVGGGVLPKDFRIVP